MYNITTRHKLCVEKLTKKLLGYYSDNNKGIREQFSVCKYCHYIDTERISGSAIWTVPCKECGKSMTFPSTCTDMLCQECADRLKLCKHCGGKLD